MQQNALKQNDDSEKKKTTMSAPEIVPPPLSSPQPISPPPHPGEQMVITAESHPRPTTSPVRKMKPRSSVPLPKVKRTPEQQSLATMRETSSHWSPSPQFQHRTDKPLLHHHQLPFLTAPDSREVDGLGEDGGRQHHLLWWNYKPLRITYLP